MKQSFLGILIFLLSAAGLYAQQTALPDVTKQIILHAELLLKKDVANWEKCWVHDDKATFRSTSSSNAYAVVGWKNIADAANIAMSSHSNAKNVQISLDHLITRQSGDMVWADYDITTVYEDTAKHHFESHESCTLIKQDGQWKIASLNQLYASSFNSTEPGDIENSLNAMGYNLLAAKKYKAAIEMFAFNVKLFPGSWNVYDSLGEAYLESGDKKMAKENYEISVKLNPANESGKKALAGLR